MVEDACIDFDISDLATIDNGTGSNTHGLTSNHSHSHSIDSAITESLPDANASIFGFDIGDSPSPAAIIPYQQPHSAAADTAADVSSQDLALTLYTSLATNSTGAASDSDPPCGCHSRALETLKQLCSSSIHSPTDSTSSKSQGSQLARSLQGVIDANERVLETVGKMVPCTCSRDGFLLAILSMIAFKVMARYEAAARRRHHFLEPNLRSSFSASSTSLSSTASSMLGGDAMERKASGSGASGGEEHDDRMAARVVLSELYRVQRFVKGFSKRVKQIASLEGGERDYHISLSGHRPTHSGSGAGDVVMGGCSDEVSLPFSPALYHQLEADLRRRLRGLSADIADLVRTA